MRLEVGGSIVLTPAIPELAEQAKERKLLFQLLEAIYSQIPDTTMDLDQALHLDLITPQQAANLYQKLSQFIATDENNARLLLYLPLQLLPKGETKFAQIYKKAWIKLLDESDVRANFVDGDCLEPGMGDPHRIRQAALLIPQLLKKGIIQNEEVQDILQCAQVQEDSELADSIMEALGVVAKRTEKTFPVGQISAKRVKWLAQVEKEKLINSEARSGANPNHPNPIIALRSVEYAADADNYLRLAQKLWQTGSSETQNEIIGGLCRLVNGRLLSKDTLNHFGIDLPDFTAILPFPPEKLIADYRFLAVAAQKIADHPTLSQYIYPFFIIIGSKLKGYAEITADKDAAMFFKSGARMEMRNELLALLRRDIPELRNLDNMPEFWIDESRGGLTLRNFSNDWFTLAGPQQAHFLLHGIWLGQDDDLIKVYQGILEKYLNLSRFGNQKKEVRRHLLRRLEMDALQYRLLHKGYRRFYGGTGEDTFWDPGYRRIASLIFLNRVFLPDLG